MNVQQQEKIKDRINKIKSVLDQNKLDLNQMSALLGERNDLQYKLNKANIFYETYTTSISYRIFKKKDKRFIPRLIGRVGVFVYELMLVLVSTLLLF